MAGRINFYEKFLFKKWKTHQSKIYFINFIFIFDELQEGDSKC